MPKKKEGARRKKPKRFLQTPQRPQRLSKKETPPKKKENLKKKKTPLRQKKNQKKKGEKTGAHQKNPF